MLKIKDEVDLKELEKYGFTRSEPEDYFTPGIDENEKTALWIFWESNGLGTIDINEKTRVILGISSKFNDVLYDLIQDGLVEKVKVQDE